MWKKTIMVLLIVAGLLVSMNVLADNGFTGSTRTDADLVIDDITLDGNVVDGKYVKEQHQITVILNNTASPDIVGSKLNCTIYNSSGMEFQWTNVDCGTIPATGTKDVLLPLWTPMDEDTYWINITISLTTGGNLTANKSFVVEDVYDLYPILTFPSADIERVCEDETNQSLVCMADVFNIGNVVVSDFDVTLEVWEGGAKLFNDTKVYASTTFNPGTTFADWFNHTYGEFQFKVYTSVVGDDNLSNDMDIQTFFVNYTFYDEIEKGNIAGVVVEGTGNATAPLEGVTVSFENPDFNQTVLTDVNGTFNHTDLPVVNNSYKLIFTLDGYYETNVSGIDVTNATTYHLPENVTMEKIPLSNVNGYVMDGSANPLIGVTVKLGIWNTTSNETGYYEFLNLSAASYPVYAYYAGYKDYDAIVDLTPGETLEHNITMILDINVTVTFQPADGEVDVSVDETILITFNTEFDPDTVNATTVILEEVGTPNNTVLAPGIKTTDDLIIEVVPTGGLKFGFTYKITVTNAITNVYNESMLEANETTATFTTMFPGVVSTVPAPDTPDVSINLLEVTVTFNTDMDIAEPIAAENFVLRAPDAPEINGTLAYDAGTKTLIFTLTESMAYETGYVVSISKFLSTDGVEMVSYSFEFDTEKFDEPPTTGTISGNITDEDGNGVSGASVEIEGYPVQITNETGYYEFTDIPEGDYNMTVTIAGYDQVTVPVDVVAGQEVEVDIPITPTSGDDGEKSFLEQYWWLLVIVAIVVLLVIIIIVVLLMRKKPEEEEEDTGRRRYAPERRERAESSYAARGGGEREYYDEEEGSECPNCGEVVSDEEEDCPNCGVEFEEDIFECPVCGDHVDYDAQECSSCGAAFQEEEEEEEDEDEYEEEEEPDYEVEVEDEDGVTRYNPKEEEEEEFGEEGMMEEEYD
jgi:hypothetical protein